MSRRKTKAEEIRNPEHYFNKYIAMEIRKDKEKDDASAGIRPCSASLTQFSFCLFRFLDEENPSNLTCVSEN